MPCVICNQNSFGSDVCPSCEDAERQREMERDWERQQVEKQEQEWPEHTEEPS